MRAVEIGGTFDVLMVVLEPSGIVYRSQVMGHCCAQESAEGVLVPVLPDYPIDESGRPAVKTLAERLRDATLNAMWLTEEVADAVDKILGSLPESRGLVVDRTRLRRSGEAWVFVTIDPEPSSDLHDFRGSIGVLTWTNSD